jgi:hypothetical protein
LKHKLILPPCRTIPIVNKFNTTINFLNYRDLAEEVLYLETEAIYNYVFYMISALLYLFYIICELKQQLFYCSAVHFWCIRIHLVFFSFYIHSVPPPLPYIFLISWNWINRWRIRLPIFTSILFQSMELLIIFLFIEPGT